MSNPNPDQSYLIPVKTKEEARKKGSNGGKKSGQVRREKKLLSQMYAEFLAREHDIVINGEKKRVSGQEMVTSVVKKVLAKGASESVSMLKELREATEGSKVALTNANGTDLLSKGIKISFAEPGKELPKTDPELAADVEETTEKEISAEE